MIEFRYDDGGRGSAGFKGEAGDCATRSIAIATGYTYRDVYHALWEANGGTPRDGVKTKAWRKVMADLGWEWTPTMQIGSGCRVHLSADELPSGRLVVRLSKHFAAVVDGVLHDTYDCSRDGTRCVYGYFREPTQ